MLYDSNRQVSINSRVDIFGASDESDAFQNNRLKNDHPIGVPFPRSYAADPIYKDRKKRLPDMARRYVIVLG